MIVIIMDVVKQALVYAKRNTTDSHVLKLLAQGPCDFVIVTYLSVNSAYTVLAMVSA